MGVEAIFDPDRGDFSGLLKTSIPIYVDRIIHKTIIEINEEFTEVASVAGEYNFNDTIYDVVIHFYFSSKA